MIRTSSWFAFCHRHALAFSCFYSSAFLLMYLVIRSIWSLIMSIALTHRSLSTLFSWVGAEVLLVEGSSSRDTWLKRADHQFSWILPPRYLLLWWILSVIAILPLGLSSIELGLRLNQTRNSPLVRNVKYRFWKIFMMVGDYFSR